MKARNVHSRISSSSSLRVSARRSPTGDDWNCWNRSRSGSVQLRDSPSRRAVEAGMSVANCSQHLQVLRAAQLVAVRREGLYSRYRLADEQVLGLWLSFRQLGESRLAEVQRVVATYLQDRHALQAVTNEQLTARLRKRDVVVLDVRPEEEFRAGHIAAAKSIPIAELEKRLKEIPKRRTVVAYCRGPYCMFADDAVNLLPRQRMVQPSRIDLRYPVPNPAKLPATDFGTVFFSPFAGRPFTGSKAGQRSAGCFRDRRSRE